jgi:hypothetical protein
MKSITINRAQKDVTGSRAAIFLQGPFPADHYYQA